MTPRDDDSIWAGAIGARYHKHDFDGPWLEGESCAECPPPPTANVLTITGVDHETGTVTVSEYFHK